LKRRYQAGDAYISIERARYYTESWTATEGAGTPLPVRVALAMKNVYENVTQYLDPDDRIAGYWTEYFLGIPIDIERGVFNEVLAAELTRGSMIRFRGRSMARGFFYLLRKGGLLDFLKNQRMASESGARPLNMGLETMAERAINPFQIDSEDRRHLLRELLPYWKGKTIVDTLEKELVKSGLFSEDMHNFATAVMGNTSRQVLMLSPCATIGSYQGHVILDFEEVLAVGLTAMLEEVRQKLLEEQLGNGPERDFLQSVEIALEGVMVFARRLADRIKREIEGEEDPGRLASLERMLSICGKVPLERAETFEEAVQSMWTVKTAVELAHPVNLHCFGRLDQTLYPYYRNDLEAGRISAEQALELLEELLLKIMSQNIRPESNILSNFYHRFLGSSPVTLGGLGPDGGDGTNDLTYLFLKAAHNSKAITNVSVRVHPGTPDALLGELAEYLYQGTSNFSLFNDGVVIEAMRRRGFSERDARDYAVMGCVEATCPGKTGGMGANALLLSRLLDVTLRNGDARLLAGNMRGEGLRTGDPDSFESFDEVVDAFLSQGRYFIKKIVDGSNLRDRLYAEKLPAPCISAFIDGCLEKGKDVTAGGGKYDLSGISMINSIANAVDSLYVIKKLVFEKGKFSIGELMEAIDCNFAGHENIYREIKQLPGKWGNGDPEVDELAGTVMKALFEETYRHRSYKGGPFVVYVISMTTHTIDGRLSVASPDGRKAATPYAASCNPYNVERSGVTAALRSVACLPLDDVMGCAVNVKFHPSGIGDRPETRAKWVSLVRTYFQLGGSQIQPTVASGETLRKAQREPEGYADLIVKVGGYSTYFVDLGREIQEEIIARTEHS
jgi:formate C-acetyltransferase